MGEISYYKSLDAFVKDCVNTNKKYLLFVAQECKFYMSLLKNSKIEAYGAFFPEIIYDSSSYKDGLVAYTLPNDCVIEFIEDMKNPKLNNEKFKGLKSLFTFVDGLSADISYFLEELFDTIEDEVKVVGGGAGVFPFEQSDVIFSPDHICKDSALLVGIYKNIHSGVKHGWKILKSPLVATMSKDNILYQIDYQEAAKVYKDAIFEDSNRSFDEEEFVEIAKSYPLGIIKYDNEVIVRDPISFYNENALHLVAGISQNSIVAILNGDKEDLIKATKDAIFQAVKHSSNNFEEVFMFDCISRRLFLEDEFDRELAVVRQSIGKRPLLGALTLGEIANEGDMYINFFNKTCVIGVI